VAAALALSGCSRPGSPGSGTETATERLDPAADARLRAMSATLAGAQAFSFSTAERNERVDAKGEKVALESTREYVLARPDRFVTSRVREGVTARAVYDGRTLSLQGDGEKVWAQVDMPATLDEALDYAALVYRIPLPIADLFYSDPYASVVGEETVLRSSGEETVAGVACDHLTIETPAVNAEVWLEQGAQALPRKLELVYKELEGEPRTTVTFYDWDLEPQIDPVLFAFTPPAGYTRLPMVASMSPEEEELVRASAAQDVEPAAAPSR
jgi:hypothetical protein